MRQKVQDNQHSSDPEPRCQPARRQRRVVKVVEPQPDGGDVELGEVGRGKTRRVRVRGAAQVALVGIHLGGGEALVWEFYRSVWIGVLLRSRSRNRNRNSNILINL